MSIISEFSKGLIKENPVFVLILGLCPTLAVTSSLEKALGMGLASTFVLVSSNLLISLVKSLIPKAVRIPIYIVIIASFVTVVKLIMSAYFPSLKESLGIFLPLITVNCIILGRAEAFASSHGPILSIADGLGMGLGFTMSLSLLGFIRESLGEGKILGIPFTTGLENYTQKIFIVAPGGFLTLGLLMALFSYIANIRKARSRS